jgi:hypothetical protein
MIEFSQLVLIPRANYRLRGRCRGLPLLHWHQSVHATSKNRDEACAVVNVDDGDDLYYVLMHPPLLCYDC